MERDEMATSSVISVFENQKIASQAIDALLSEGFKDRDIEVLRGKGDELMGEIAEHGFGKEDAREFAEAAGKGKTLVAARAPEEKLERAVAIMERFETYQDRGSQGSGAEEAVQVVEEELSVGKRKVASGGVRVTTSVSERPVKETVRLREEHVEAERRSADRPLSAKEAEAAFEEKTVEMMGTSEQVEVRKEARVVGEVALTKETKERQQTVKDTVRRTDVEVEQIEPASSKRK
jgi:stress response protein YsnF